MKVIRGMVVNDDGSPLPSQNLTKDEANAVFNVLGAAGSVAFPPLGIPIGLNQAYQGYKNKDIVQSLLGGAEATLGGLYTAPKLAYQYAKGAMMAKPVTMNIEATSPNMLQNVERDVFGNLLSDMRYEAARKGALNKGMDYAKVDPLKTRGVWVEPTKPTEFNRVYSQALPPTNASTIQNYMPLQKYAESMGGDLSQYAVGANRFSKLPLNLSKDRAQAVKYNNVTESQIKDAGMKLGNKSSDIVVSATPDGGMVIFDSTKQFTPKQLAKEIKTVANKPKYGLLDSAYWETGGLTQGEYMNPVDALIRQRGY